MIDATTGALVRAFAPAEVKIFSLRDLTQAATVLQHVREMQSARRLSGDPVRIVLFDQTVQFRRLLKLLLFVFEGKVPPGVFFTYGSFAKNMRTWYEAWEELKELRLTLIAPSRAQEQMLETLIYEPQLEVCPPPVEDVFAFNLEARLAVRDYLNIGADERVFIYSGRIAMEKNLPLLVREFLHWRNTGAQKARLLIAGPLDDVDGGLVRDLSTLGHQFQNLSRETAASGAVHYLGNLGRMELGQTLAAADVFVSLSLFHQEAFGLAAAEATVSGLPLILTDWGGFRSFSHYNMACDLVPVQFALNEYILDRKALASMFDRVSILSAAERVRRSGKGNKVFSADSIAADLRFVFMTEPKPFLGFKPEAKLWVDLADVAKRVKFSRDDCWRSFQANKNEVVAAHFIS